MPGHFSLALGRCGHISVAPCLLSLQSVLLTEEFFFLRTKLFSNTIHRPVAANAALNAEGEKDGKESNFEADHAKLKEEAEKRIEEKVAELMKNIDTVGEGWYIIILIKNI